MPSLSWVGRVPVTPAFVYDEAMIVRCSRRLGTIAKNVNCSVLFALKSFAIPEAVGLMVPDVHGFAASSLFEAFLARELLRKSGTVHITTPGLRADEIEAICEVADYLAFNSMSQLERFGKICDGRIEYGLRLNPEHSLLKDKRYNPCRKNSKLGVPLSQMVNLLRLDNDSFRGITGLHFHTNCESTSFLPLLGTVLHIERKLGSLLSEIRWVNLGGGYIFDCDEALDAFYETVNLLRRKYRLEVFIEPGAAIVSKAGYLIGTVLDIFENGSRKIAILDTTVNHMPEVFEYQFSPDVAGHVETGRYKYILAGCTCLAGDLFGEYTFDEPLKVGSRVIFTDMGAYTLVKSHMFNGVNLPTIYALSEHCELILKKQFTYDDFASRCGVDSHATV